MRIETHSSLLWVVGIGKRRTGDGPTESTTQQMKRRGEKRAGVGSARTAVGASANGGAARAQCLGRPARPLAALTGHVAAASMLHTVAGILKIKLFSSERYLWYIKIKFQYLFLRD